VAQVCGANPIFAMQLPGSVERWQEIACSHFVAIPFDLGCLANALRREPYYTAGRLMRLRFSVFQGIE
jgi:hypothetical protein